MKKVRKSAAMLVLFALLCTLILVPAAHATNGMNLEGYGPIATGMGGASMAYDNGTAAMMNNPATLSLMDSNARLDVAFGTLGPNITSKAPGEPDAESSADLFMMPAFGYARKGGQLTYGMGVFAQGGMGTEYSADSFLAAGSNDIVRSEVAMGRFLIPVSYKIDDKFIIGGSLDFVWASMDLKMALGGAQFGDMVAQLGGTQSSGTASGSMVDSLAGAFMPGSCGPGVPCLSDMNWARFDFSDQSDFSGKAKGNGFGAKIGGVLKASKDLTFGVAYHTKTAISDLEATGATLSMNVVGAATGGNAMTVPVTGDIKVKNFQWPRMLGLGTAYKASPKLTVVFDYKWINWADVMKNFKMTFTSYTTQAGAAGPGGFNLGGQTVDAVMYQNWKNQHVFMLGAAYNFTDAFVGRAGLNIAGNPIPDQYMNPLFPATIKNHIMLGGGYAFTKSSSVDFSFTYAPEVEATTQVLAGPASGAVTVPVTVTHSQNNMQVMYSYKF